MGILASDFGRVGAYIVALSLAFMLLLALVAAGVYAVGRAEQKLQHWVPAIVILVALVLTLLAAYSCTQF